MGRGHWYFMWEWKWEIFPKVNSWGETWVKCVWVRGNTREEITFEYSHPSTPLILAGVCQGHMSNRKKKYEWNRMSQARGSVAGLQGQKEAVWQEEWNGTRAEQEKDECLLKIFVLWRSCYSTEMINMSGFLEETGFLGQVLGRDCRRSNRWRGWWALTRSYRKTSPEKPEASSSSTQ